MNFRRGQLSIEMRKNRTKEKWQPGKYLEALFNPRRTGKSLHLPCRLGLRCVDHRRISQSPKSSIIAAVGEAGQQMLFGAQERGNYQSLHLSSAAELSVVLNAGLRVSTRALLVKRKWSTPLPHLCRGLPVIACGPFHAICFIVSSRSFCREGIFHLHFGIPPSDISRRLLLCKADMVHCEM